MSKRTIFLDMDGVIADFATPAIKLFVTNEAAVKHLINTWPRGEGIDKVLGLSEKEFWAKINEQGIDFWAQLPKYDWAQPLINVAQEYGDVMILSSPARGGNSAAGKVVWIEQNCSRLSRSFILTPKKHKVRLARPGDVLVDDHVQTCGEWHDAGGYSVVFPGLWNSLPDHTNPLPAVTDRLKALCT